MSTRIVVPGRKAPALEEGADLVIRQRFQVTVEHVAALQLSDSNRRDVVDTAIDATDEQLVELQFDDGTREWMRVDHLRRRLTAGERSISDPDTIRLTPSMGESGERGVGDWLLKGLELLDLDVPELVAEEVAPFVAAKFENQLAPGPGLYPIERQGNYGKAIERIPDSHAAALVLIHGMFSTTGATFGRLFTTPEWQNLYDQYDGRIFGLEHRTISESPAANAVALLQALPDGVRLHLVTHSRGGLIGELIARGGAAPEDLRPFQRPGRPAGEHALFERLAELIRTKAPQVERFVRVACPARGMLLASERLDRYLSILLNLIGLIPGVDDPLIYPFAKATILTLIKQRADLRLLPGLEAMMPESPFIRFVNMPGASSDADLAVIAGDVEGRSLLSRLGVLATDLFCRQDHDLVVHTDSMFCGITRRRPLHYLLEKGAEISHFNYFKNESSRRALANWLHRSDDEIPRPFKRLESAPVPETERGMPLSMPINAPLVYLIPSLMGTRLLAGGRPLWPDLPSLAQGEVVRLALDGGEDGVKVGELIAENYEELQTTLAGRLALMSFAYDWRKSLLEEGKRLAAEIDALLRKHDSRKVHLLAHGTGGFVVLGLIARSPETWQRLVERGGRLVMLGTPVRGASAIRQLLSGHAQVVRMLALLDPDQDTSKIARIFRTFPGVLELLPVRGDHWSIGWWQAQALLGADEMSGFQSRLEAAHKHANLLQSSLLELSRAGGTVAYVAGSAAIDTLGDTLERDESLDFAADALAGPEGAPTWYMRAAPGAMTARPQRYLAFADLLERGASDDLALVPPEGLSQAPRGARPPGVALFPNTAELIAAATGRRTGRRIVRDPAVLRVSVVHGSLEHASHPVALGHYFGDVIVGTEAFLDRKLDGRLTQRFSLRLYPGERGTAEVILAPDRRPTGAIIIGLGEVGNLSAEALTEGVMLAALRHALEVLEMGCGATGSQQWRSAAFSAVLIGTNGGRSLSVETSLTAMVKGALLANRLLREQGMLQRVRIDEVEIVELYEDVAIRAARAVRQLRDTLSLSPDESESLEPVEHLRSAEGGLPRGAPSTYDPDWWRRIQISETGPRAADGTSGLEFIMLTDRARAEQTLEATQRALIDRFVEEAVGQHRTAATQATTTALYELLLPNTIKEQAEETANLMLVLDDAAANYPWEMLREREQEPLSVRYGMLRQLKTAQFRTGMRAPRGLNALVIGDPDAGDPRYRRLNGARMEAEQAAAELAKYGYVVDAQIGTSGLDVVRALYAREYRVIHIAAHGVYQVTQKEGRPSQVRTGVVIGRDYLLTAAEIAKLRPVPELVFLNCCHLAQTDTPVGDPASALNPFNKLAASLAKELVDIGVRAVVAAGWAVDDTAACEFAGEFYRHMLVESRQFGEAVRMARRRIYDNHQAKSNTWGAYQCYGMPSFTLSGKPQRDPRAVRPPVSKHEILDQLHQIRGDAENAESSQHKVLLQRLQQNDRWLRSEWRTSDTLYALAETYSALGELETAIGLYQAALDSEETRSEAPLRAVEQLAKLELRRAEQLRRGLLAAEVPPDPAAEKKRKRLLKNAEERLELLLKVAANVERLALMGGYWKRMALSTDGDERRQALVKAAKHYKRAAERATDEHKPYPALNWVICQFLANEDAENAAQLAELLQTVAECERTARELQKLTTDYWKRVYIADALLLRALLTSTLDQEADAIVRHYQVVFRTRSTARERTTSLGHLDFVSTMLDVRSPRLAATVQRVRKALEE